MELIEILKEWVGLLSLVLTGVVWWFVKLNADKIKANESAKQEVQHTEQAKLETDEKALDLDQRRVRASEEVASEALEDMAEARRENLKLLESDYEKSKAIIEMQAEIKMIKAELVQIKEEKTVVGFFYCGKTECELREPKLGTFSFNCISMEMLKKIMTDGKTA